MYSMLSSEVEGGDYDSAYTTTTKISMIIPKFMVRFYF